MFRGIFASFCQEPNIAIEHLLLMPNAQPLHFLQGFLTHPLGVASPVPSGRRLARTIAEQIDSAMAGPVLELGPGTGAVTAAILERGIPDADLIAVESDPKFVMLLREKYPNVRILRGDAFRFAEIVRTSGEHVNYRAVVSGVPVLSRPIAERRQLLTSAIECSQQHAPFIQFSYGSKPPIPPVRGVGVEHAAFVWQNIPPLHVWVYRRIPLAAIAREQ